MTDEHGEKLQYDPKWKGPLKGRSCTDCFCLIIFLAVIVGWAGVGYYAYVNGDITALLIPTDSEGRKCGNDPEVSDKKFLLFFNPIKCINLLSVIFGCDTPQVCVHQCPTKNFFWDTEIQYNDWTTVGNKMICKIGTDMNNLTEDRLQAYVKNENCARTYFDSEPIGGRCIPIKIPSALGANLTLNTAINAAPKSLGDVVMLGKSLAKLIGIVDEVYNDFMTTKWTITAILGCSIAVTLLYILLMRWLAIPIVFISIIALSGLLGYTTYYFYLLYAADNSTFWLTLTITCGALLGIILLVCIFLRNRIRLACQLIGEASKAVLGTTSTFVFPIVPWLLQIAVLACGLAIGAHVLSLRESTYTVKLGDNCDCFEELGFRNGTACVPEKFNSICMEKTGLCTTRECYLSGRKRLWFSNYMQALNICAVLWLSFFMSAFGEMVMAGTFATWYWTFRKSDVPFFTLTVSVWRTLRYHVGTLAFGSLIITICRLVRWVLEYIDSKLKQYDNELLSFLLKCMKCCFWLLEKFLKFINKNAYIMCAIHGKCFCLSAKSAFSLLMRNIIRVAVINKITDWLLFLGKILVTGVVSWCAWWYIDKQFLDKINYLAVPVTLIAIGTYLITSMFFSVYSMAVDTLFLCFLEDSERNDGTPDKPYYMSKGLLRILRKS